MKVYETILTLLSHPTPVDLYRLGALLREQQLDAPAATQPAFADALETASNYYTFLTSIQAKMTAEGYNKLASLLDVGAVGSVTLQNLLVERENLLQRLVVGTAGESLMLIGSLQYIKAWEQETRALHEQAAWQLYDALWKLSQKGQPDLPGAMRRQIIEALLAPCFDAEVQATQRTVYVGWMFQLVLLTILSHAGLNASGNG
jgi:hypothetical protein